MLTYADAARTGLQAARTGLQEAVRLECLAQRRASGGMRRSGGERARGLGVPVVRHLCALHPASVDVELELHAPEVCYERWDEHSVEGVAGVAGARRLGHAPARAAAEVERQQEEQQGSEMLRASVIEWLICRLGMQAGGGGGGGEGGARLPHTQRSVCAAGRACLGVRCDERLPPQQHAPPPEKLRWDVTGSRCVRL